MPEILTQSEIDRLLSSMSDNNNIVEEKLSTDWKVKNYDFKNPKEIPKEQIKILRSIHDNFARHLSSYFSGILRLFCEINVTAIEEQPYYEYNNALPDVILIGVMDAKPIEGPILVDISNSITFSLLERLLGGNGKGLVPEREFTEIEVLLMERIFQQISLQLRKAWTGLEGIETSLRHIESNSRLIQVMPMDEVVVIVVMEVTIGSIKGNITISVPCINLEQIIDDLTQVKQQATRKTDNTQEESSKSAMVSHIYNAPITGSAVFGTTVLTLQEVLNLQVGDVIKFDQEASTGVHIEFEGRTWFYGIPGIRRNKKVIKISKVV